MCGLVGIAGKLDSKDDTLIKRMLLIDTIRGDDSTGLARVGIGMAVTIAKLASHPLDLFQLPAFKTAANGLSAAALIGHNRATTRGLTTTFNAHPFEFDHIVGAHNGTLDYAAMGRLEDALGEKFNVDSQALIAGIARLGVEKTFGMITGAWSVVWFDTKAKTINFLRNDKRPMWYAFNKECDRIFWGSEHEIVSAAMSLLPAPYDLYSDKDGYSYFFTEPDTWYSYPIDAFTTGKRPKAKAKTVKGKEAGVVAPAPFIQADRPGTPKNSNTTYTSKNNSTTTYRSGSSPQYCEHTHRLPYGGLVDAEELEAAAAKGCFFCDNKKPIDLNTDDWTYYEKSNIILCPKHSRGAMGGAPRIYLKSSTLIS